MHLSESNVSPTTVAVIGAGIAGLSCASALQAQGLSVKVFEKSRGVGGRMSTRRGDGWACDHGAQYFTARSDAFQKEVAAWLAAGVVQRWEPRIVVIDEEMGVSEASQKSSTVRYVGAPAMTAPANHLAQNLSLALESCVDKLIREPHGWRLRLSSGEWQDDLFDAVVLALPAPQALALMPPKNDSYRQLLAGVQMQATWTLILHLEEEADLGFDAAFVNSGPIRWIARQRSKPMREGANVYLLHASTQWSEAHREVDAIIIERLLVDAFSALFGVIPLAVISHRWLFSETNSPIRRSFLWDSDVGLGLCGDWLKESKIEGAWESAIGLSQLMLHDLQIKYLDVKYKKIIFGGAVYKEALNLRNEILRKPLGRSLDNEDIADEDKQLHYGLLNGKGTLLACLSAKIIDEKHYKLRQMAVIETSQKKGLGARLVKEVERGLAERGVTELSLHARESAIGFYEKLGYRCSGELFDEVGIPHIKMLKNIV